MSEIADAKDLRERADSLWDLARFVFGCGVAILLVGCAAAFLVATGSPADAPAEPWRVWAGLGLGTISVCGSLLMILLGRIGELLARTTLTANAEKPADQTV